MTFPFVTFFLVSVLTFTTFMGWGYPFIPSSSFPYYVLGAFGSVFIHSGTKHLMSNLTVLIVFGSVYEIWFGHKKASILYVLSYFLMGIFMIIIIGPAYDYRPVAIVGSSGWIAVVVAFFLLTSFSHFSDIVLFMTHYPDMLRHILHSRSFSSGFMIILTIFCFIIAVILAMSVVVSDIRGLWLYGISSEVGYVVHIMGYVTALLVYIECRSLRNMDELIERHMNE